MLTFFLLLLSGCTKEKKIFDDQKRTVTTDSVSILLNLADNTSLSIKNRVTFNDRAFQILKRQPNDSIYRQNLFKVANRYYNFEIPNAYKQASSYILQKSIESRDTLSIAKSYSYLGDYYFYMLQRKDSALYYFLASERISIKLDDNRQLAKINIMIANVFWDEKDFLGSESAALDALKYGRLASDVQKEYEALTFLGIISNELADYYKALEYLDRAIKLAEVNQLEGEQQLMITLNNIGNVYQNLGQNGTAIKKFKEALKHKEIRNSNPRLYAALLENLAYSKFKAKENDNEIILLFYKSISINDSLQNYPAVIFGKTRLAEYYHSIGRTDAAISLCKEALYSAKQHKAPLDMLQPLKHLSEYETVNPGIYSIEYIKINDSLQEAERKSRDKFARIQFETEEISLKNYKLEEQIRNQLLFFVGTVMIGLLLFVIRTQRAKNRELLHKQAQQKANEDIYNLMLSQQNKIEEGRIQEKKRIAQELHDGVLGRLFGARLNLDSLNKQDGEVAEEKRNNYLSELKNIEQDIREISHDLNREKFVLINNFIAILNNLLEEQSASFGAEVVVNVEQSIKWDRVSNAIKINLYRIVQEALQNINKYASASEIQINLSQHSGSIHLNITDNGVGFAVDRKSKGIGLQNMVSRVGECDGVFDIKSKKGKGTTISIEFPIENKFITA